MSYNYGNGMNYMGQNNGPNPLMMAANLLNNAFNGPQGMNGGPQQNMGMGPMGASPQPPSNWREMMNKNAAQQRMYPNQMGPQMHQGQGQRMGGGGGGPHKRFRDNKGATINKPQQVTFQAKFLKSQSEPPQQRMGGQAQFKKAKSPGVGKNDLRRQLQERKSRERSTGPGDGAVAAQANAKAKAAKANASAKKAAFKKKLSEGGTKDAESSGESKTETTPAVDGDEEVVEVENDEDVEKKSPYFGIPSGLLFDPICNLHFDSPSKFEQHLKSKGRAKVLKLVAEQDAAMEVFLRGQCKLAEARRDAKRGTFIPKNKHQNKFVNSDEHKNLQKFLHPWLDGKKFQTRAQLERHMVSPAYLKSLAEKGVTDANKHYTDLMDLQLDSLAERSAAWTKPPKESSKEYFEISRKIKTYTLPEYDEENPQPIGFSSLKTVSVSHCKLTGKTLITKEELENHLKSREVYDKFAADVAERRERVAASEAKRNAAKEAKKRSASEAALEGVEADATAAKPEPVIKTEEEGNFKRPKKAEEDEEEFDDDIDGPGLEGPDLLADDEVEAEDATATA